MADDEQQMWDCAIVGGGPAGLTAALYLARFHLRALVVDAGDGRCNRIPRTHNHAGFPDGISGAALLARMRRQARHYGAEIRRGRVQRICREEEAFHLETGQAGFRARRLLLATGTRNREPPLDARTHRQALASGRLRYCPVCDGYEVTDRTIGIWGAGTSAIGEALFLRSYSDRVSLVPPEGNLALADRARLEAAGVSILAFDAPRLELDPAGMAIVSARARHLFDSLYVALGSDPAVELAQPLGVALAEDGSIRVDRHQRTSVEGLYAAGDVVLGLDQISHAMGEGGVAATAIRNDIAGQTPLLRQAGQGLR